MFLNLVYESFKFYTIFRPGFQFPLCLQPTCCGTYGLFYQETPSSRALILPVGGTKSLKYSRPHFRVTKAAPTSRSIGRRPMTRQCGCSCALHESGGRGPGGGGVGPDLSRGYWACGSARGSWAVLGGPSPDVSGRLRLVSSFRGRLR